MNKAIVLVVLFAGGWLMAQAKQDQAQNQQKEKNGQVAVQGCVTRSSGEFLLMQSNAGNSYVLEATRKIKFEPYLGHQVQVTGSESPTMSTSSNSRRRAGSPVTILVDSISTISKRCGS